LLKILKSIPQRKLDELDTMMKKLSSAKAEQLIDAYKFYSNIFHLTPINLE
jgi:hypothetical protein